MKTEENARAENSTSINFNSSFDSKVSNFRKHEEKLMRCYMFWAGAFHAETASIKFTWNLVVSFDYLPIGNRFFLFIVQI